MYLVICLSINALCTVTKIKIHKLKKFDIFYSS